MTPECSLLQKIRQDAVDIFNEGLAAVDPKACIHRCCRLENNILEVNNMAYDLDKFERIIVLGTGKAGASMAGAIEEILQDRLTAGIVIVKYEHVENLERMMLVEAGHPVPDANGVAGTEKLLKMARKADEKTLVICLISGGGSALMTLPAQGLTLEDKQKTTAVLLDCGHHSRNQYHALTHVKCNHSGSIASRIMLPKTDNYKMWRVDCEVINKFSC